LHGQHDRLADLLDPHLGEEVVEGRSRAAVDGNDHVGLRDHPDGPIRTFEALLRHALEAGQVCRSTALDAVHDRTRPGAQVVRRLVGVVIEARRPGESDDGHVLALAVEHGLEEVAVALKRYRVARVRAGQPRTAQIGRHPVLRRHRRRVEAYVTDYADDLAAEVDYRAPGVARSQRVRQLDGAAREIRSTRLDSEPRHTAGARGEEVTTAVADSHDLIAHPRADGRGRKVRHQPVDVGAKSSDVHVDVVAHQIELELFLDGGHG